jgi:hypothetical protein
MNRQIWRPDTGACRRDRASNKHGIAPGRIRRLHRGLPPRRVGVRIRQCSVRSGPGDRGPRELRLLERVSIRIVPGVRPGRPADTGRGRCLVRPARRRGRRPCPGLAGGRPPWPRRDRPIWAGYSPRRPGTRPDMAGRQRQLVFLTRTARRYNGIRTAVRFHPIRLSTCCARSDSAEGRRIRSLVVARSPPPGRAPCDGPSVETELVALDVLHHEARLVVVIGKQ